MKAMQPQGFLPRERSAVAKLTRDGGALRPVAIARVSTGITRTCIAAGVFVFIAFLAYGVTWIPSVLYIKLAMKPFALVAACGVLSIAIGRRGIQVNMYDIAPVLGYISMAVISAYHSAGVNYVIMQSIALASIVFISCSLAICLDEEGINRLFSIFCCLMGLSVLASLVGYLVAPNLFGALEEGRFRVHGVFGEPAELAAISSFTAIVAICVIKGRAVKTLVSIAAMASLYLSGTRAAVIGLVAVLVFIFLTANKSVFIARLSFVILGILLAIWIGGNIVNNRLAKDSYFRGGSVTSFSGRTSIWTYAIPIAVFMPFGYGYCLGGTVLTGYEFSGARPAERSPDFDPLGRSGTYKVTLHNGYVQALCDVGPIGFLFYLTVFLRAFWLSYKKRNEGSRSVAMSMAVVVFVSVMNISESIVMSPTTNSCFLFWLSFFVLSVPKRYTALNG
jgi:O-antigen ligase